MSLWPFSLCGGAVVSLFCCTLGTAGALSSHMLSSGLGSALVCAEPAPGGLFWARLSPGVL